MGGGVKHWGGGGVVRQWREGTRWGGGGSCRVGRNGREGFEIARWRRMNKRSVGGR